MNVFRILLKWKYHLLILTGAAVILTAVFTSSLFLKPLYKSFAVLYPANIFPYSDESETEQMLQLMNASTIRDSLIDKYDLGSHWGLDNKDKHFYSTLLYLYGKRVNIRKTEFESVVVSVTDTDPKLAFEMVNDIVRLYDMKVKSMQKLKFYEVVVNYKEVLAEKQQSLDSIQSEIDALTTGKGLAGVTTPGAALIRTYADNIQDQKDKEDLDAVKRMRARSGSKESRMLLLTSLAMSEAEAYSEFKLKYDQAVLNYNRDYTYSNVVVSPYIADKKSFPKTWLIITFSALAVFFLSLVVISLIENKKSVKGSHANGVSTD